MDARRCRQWQKYTDLPGAQSHPEEGAKDRCLTLDGGKEHTRSISKFRSIPLALSRYFVSTYNTRVRSLTAGPHPQPRHRNNKTGNGKASKGSKRGQEHAKR